MWLLIVAALEPEALRADAASQRGVDGLTGRELAVASVAFHRGFLCRLKKHALDVTRRECDYESIQLAVAALFHVFSLFRGKTGYYRGSWETLHGSIQVGADPPTG